VNILLKGVVGSTAYGLDHADSDKDYLGVFAAPTKDLLGLHPPKDSVVTKDPDTTVHEAKKFIGLCLGGNPTVSELLWLDEYEVSTRIGQHLISIRESLLGADRVRNAYLGYAWQQFERLSNRGGTFSADTAKRTEKHARHMVRLVQQGLELYRTGQLTIRVDDPEYVRTMGARIAADPQIGGEFMQQAQHDFDGVKTVLPEKASELEAAFWLDRVRTEYWRPRP
jgi:predicted nucleotidyltransferase